MAIIFFMLCITVPQPFVPYLDQPTIPRINLSWLTVVVDICFHEVGRAHNQNKAFGVVVESNMFKRSLSETLFFVKTVELRRNLYQTQWIRWSTSTVPRCSIIPDISTKVLMFPVVFENTDFVFSSGDKKLKADIICNNLCFTRI